jgi:peroxiredoxin
MRLVSAGTDFFMAKTPSTMLELGTVAPVFKLKDAFGKVVSLDDFKGAPATLVMFICNHCPFVIHLADSLAAITREYMAKGLAVVAINSNDTVKYPDDAPDKMRLEIENRGYKFPYLIDEDQAVAKAYRAACTPDFYLFGRDMKLAYRGQWHDSRPGSNVTVDGSSMRIAIDALLGGDQPGADQKPSLGCNIKWKSGNEPSWFG